MRKIGGRKLIVLFVLGFSGWISSQVWGSSFFSASESVQTESVEDTLPRGGEKKETPPLFENVPDSLAAVEVDEEEDIEKPSQPLTSETKKAEEKTKATSIKQPSSKQAASAKTLQKSESNSIDSTDGLPIHDNSDGHHDNHLDASHEAAQGPDTSDHEDVTKDHHGSDDHHSSDNHTSSDQQQTENHHDESGDHHSDDNNNETQHKSSDHDDEDTSSHETKNGDHTTHKEDTSHETHDIRGAQNHAASVALIKKSTVRNRAEDSSPYLNTPSSELYNKSDLYGSARDYLEGSGYYNGPTWLPRGYFPNNGAGTFRANCEVSHFSYDDPIVFPGQPEAAHLHMFLGNTNTNAYSTYDTLLNSGGSTCNGGELNRTAYWVPAMFDGKENIVVPSKVLFYYKTENPKGIGKVQQYPENLQLVGDTKNNKQNDLGLSTFRCNTIYNGAKAQPSGTIPNCPSAPYGQPGALEYIIFYDYCWNGDESTIGDWEANRDKNFAAPINYWHSSVCPTSHPVMLPALVTHIFYDLKPSDDTSKWFLSSDVDADSRVRTAPGGSTAHADWFGAWNKQINAEWIDNCSNTLNAECASGLLADPKGDPDSNVRALRLRNDFVTGYDSPKARIPVKDIYDQMCSQSDSKPYNSDQGGALAAYCKPEAHKH